MISIRPLIEPIRKLHIYSGLFMFSALLVFAVAGIGVALEDDPRERVPEVKRVPFSPPAGADPRQVADLVRDRFGFGQSKPIPDWAIGTDDEGHLKVPLWSPNGYVTVRVLEGEAELTIDRFGTVEYITEMHTAMPLSERALFAWIWSVYMELAIFALAFLSVSGVFLWAATRPKVWWAAASFAVGTSIFIAFYAAVR